MRETFKSFLVDKLDVDPSQKLLLAVSGGMDSMCLWDLCRYTKLNYVVAHCNFKLRGESSDLDEKFVQEYALNDEIVFTKSFDTDKFARERSISIQMAARDLRYTWFEELQQKEKCDFIVTAHHLDDQVETFFIQLLRKSNLPGLSGMPVRTDKIVRPLMFVGRESIEVYINEHKVPFREDESNATDAYLRNRIRRNLIPVLQKVLPDFKLSILELMGNMKEVSDSLDQYFEKKKPDLVIDKGDEKRISIAELMIMDFPVLFLEHLLKPLGFGQTAVKNLFDSLEGSSGKEFYSKTFRIVKDRNEVIIVPIKHREDLKIMTSKSALAEQVISFLNVEIHEYSGSVLKKYDKNVALLDFDALEEKISFRKWKKGDYYYPLNLGGKKKLSDFFVDKKMSLLEKDEQWIMCSGNDICWILGRAIDDRFKIRDNTKVVLLLEQHR